MNVGDTVELRVHGVSGTPAEELLDRRLVTMVAGNGTAGFYRPTLEAERDDDYPAGASVPSIKGPELEGYVWGGLTSGAPGRAFWLLLLPFSLINVAPRLRPGDPADPASGPARRRLWLIWFVSRLLALVLTVVLVAAFAGIGVDLVGWQCTEGRCRNATPGWLMNTIVDKSTPHRLAIGTLLPLAALLVLWFVSGRTIRDNEHTERLHADVDDPDDSQNATEVRLGSRWMWDNERPVRRLRAIHLQTGIAVTFAFVSAPMSLAWQWIDGTVAVLVAVYAVLVLCAPSFVGHGEAPHWRRISLVIWFVLAAEGVLTYVWLLFAAHPLDPHYAPPASLPGFGGTLLWLLIGQLVLIIVLVVVVWRTAAAEAAPQPLGEPGPKTGLRGQGTSVLTLMAVFLANVFTSSAYLFGASWLDAGTIKPSPDDVSAATHHFVIPEAILDAALAYTLAVAMAVLVLACFAGWAVWCLKTVTPSSPLLDPERYDTDYDPATASTARGKSVLDAMWLGRVVDVAGAVLGWLMAFGAVLTAAFGVVLCFEHLGADWAQRVARRISGSYSTARLWFVSPETLQALGAYLAVWTLLLLVALGALAFRIPTTRRSVGILWDLASFWPRLAHPLAPPCYAERTVPDLTLRIRWYASAPQNKGVVVSAHSQGTVIGAATMLQLTVQDATQAPALPKVGLLTFGCVLRRLYGRYFPAYFGAGALSEVRGALAIDGETQRWRNLWRYSDYLGGPIMSGPPPRVQPVWTATGPRDPADGQPGPVKIDSHLRDPEFAIAPGDTVYPAPGRHSDFWKVPEFQQAVAFVASLI